MRAVVVASVLALTLATATGAASAQSLGYDARSPQFEPYGQQRDGVYDVARVVRVDPVFDDGYGQRAPGQRCYTREDSYVGDDGYGGYDRYDDRRGDGRYGDDGYGTDRGTENGRMVATVVGGVVGAVLGSKVGGGSGRYATSAIGTMVGGMAGREIYDAARRDRYERRGQVTVCDPLPAGYPVSDRSGGVGAYDVTYEYGGRQYTTRTDYHPGDTIRVRVDVRPE